MVVPAEISFQCLPVSDDRGWWMAFANAEFLAQYLESWNYRCIFIMEDNLEKLAKQCFLLCTGTMGNAARHRW